MKVRLLIFIALISVVAPALGQRRVKLKKADNLYGSIKDGQRYDRLIGNVVFVQNNTTIYCDSAHFFKSDNRVEAFGKIHIIEGDSVDVTSNGLSYDGNDRIAHLRKNVVFTKLGLATLYTDFLDYYRNKNEARYFNGGKLVDSTNVLTSIKGYYDVNTNMASFKRDVVGVNDEYTLNSDTLQYNSRTKVIFFRDHTIIKDKEGGTAVYESGFYDTSKKQSSLNRGEIETQSYKLNGDKYFLNDLRKFYKAKGNVVMTSKEENLIIYGDDGDYDRKAGITKVYGNAYLAKIADDNDTLFLTADTLVSVESPDPAKKKLLAYHNVKIFKSDLQGIADSVVYVAHDSILYFFNDPVLWTEENQMTADSIRMLITNKTIDKIFLVNNSFVVSEDSLSHFNQIKGRKMTAIFDGKAINHVDVMGNGESIYYALQELEKKSEGQDSVQTIAVLTGMNKIICSNMKINFKEGKVNNISFYVRPDASFIPPHEIREGDKKLRGFVWRKKEKPEKEDVVKSKSEP
ncbi:MAG TPA: OstA-like protein [Cyclobacteriaceae bacterium]|nr:OstA-like protein [Cyclobacteriaceae bacterium]